MADYLSPSAVRLLNAITPAIEDAGIALGDTLNTLGNYYVNSAGAMAATALEIDAVCDDGNVANWDEDGTVGLDFAYTALRICWGQTMVDYPADTITLSGSSTNYVEATPAGTIVKNTSGFTAGYMPLFQVTTSSGAVTAVVRKRALVSIIQTGGITGALLSTAAKTTRIQRTVGTLSATGSVVIAAPPFAATLVGLRVIVTTTFTAADTDYWDFALVNKGAAGTGTTAMLSSGAENTTQATGGSGFTNYVAKVLTLHGTPANLVVAANDVLVFTATKHASAVNLVGVEVVAEWSFAV